MIRNIVSLLRSGDPHCIFLPFDTPTYCHVCPISPAHLTSLCPISPAPGEVTAQFVPSPISSGDSAPRPLGAAPPASDCGCTLFVRALVLRAPESHERLGRVVRVVRTHARAQIPPSARSRLTGDCASVHGHAHAHAHPRTQWPPGSTSTRPRTPPPTATRSLRLPPRPPPPVPPGRAGRAGHPAGAGTSPSRSRRGARRRLPAGAADSARAGAGPLRAGGAAAASAAVAAASAAAARRGGGNRRPWNIKGMSLINSSDPLRGEQWRIALATGNASGPSVPPMVTPTAAHDTVCFPSVLSDVFHFSPHKSLFFRPLSVTFSQYQSLRLL